MSLRWRLVYVVLFGQSLTIQPAVEAKVSIQQTLPTLVEVHPDGDVTVVVLAAIGRTGS